MEATHTQDLSDDSDEENKTQKQEPVLTEKEKLLRESLMKDIYNDMSSSSDEEEKEATPKPVESADQTPEPSSPSRVPPKDKKKGEYTAEDM
jgi:hypothetical protein